MKNKMSKTSADNWNAQAEVFKNSEERKIKYNVERKIERDIFIWGETVRIIYYMYKDKTTGKRLVIYPSEGLADNGRNKYYKECVEKCVENNIYASKGDNSKLLIPYHVYYYHREQLKKEVLNNLTLKDYKNLEYKTIQIDIDDAYIRVSFKGRKIKVRVRMATIHTLLSGSSVKAIENKTSIMQFLPLASEFKNFNSEEDFENKIRESLNSLYKENCEIIVSGDGAKFITTIADNLKATRVYDPFHFKANMFKAFGYSKKINVSNKRFFKDYKDVYRVLDNLFSKGLIYEFEKELDSVLEWITKQEKNKTVYANAKKFKKYYKENREYIWNSVLVKNYFGGCAETVVGHDLKRFCSKKFATFSLKTIQLSIAKNMETKANLFFI